MGRRREDSSTFSAFLPHSPLWQALFSLQLPLVADKDRAFWTIMPVISGWTAAAQVSLSGLAPGAVAHGTLNCAAEPQRLPASPSTTGLQYPPRPITIAGATACALLLAGRARSSATPAGQPASPVFYTPFSCLPRTARLHGNAPSEHLARTLLYLWRMAQDGTFFAVHSHRMCPQHAGAAAHNATAPMSPKAYVAVTA